MKNLRLLVIGLFFVVLGSNAQKIKHPSLLFTVERVNQAKQRIKTEPKMNVAWENLLKKSDAALKSNDLNQADVLTLAYLMTNERKYADQVKSILLKSVQGKPWSSTDEMMLRKPAWRADLGLAHKCNLAAIAFDGIYNTLSTEEKKQIAQGLYNYGVEPSLGDWFLDPTRIHSLNSMGHNWWTACTCMGGLLATSIENEIPLAAKASAQLYEQLPEWFAFAGDELQNKMKSFDENGGMYESINYATFGIGEALKFSLGWQNAHPSIKPNDIPELALTPSFFMYMSYPRTGILYSMNFGDSHSNVVGDNTLMLLYALGNKDRNILWYLNQVVDSQHRESNSLQTPLGLLYAPNLTQAPAEPDLKLSQLFSNFGWATMRTSWEKNATLLAVKSGHTWNHSHADATSFQLYHQGEVLLKDAGNCSYPNPEYGAYFFQSQAHNVVLFNGEGQPTNQQYEGSMLDGKLTDLMDAGNIKYVLANGTGPYARNFVRNFRHFLWLDNVIYVLDDLKTYASGTFEWLWHPQGQVRKNGIDVVVTNNNASLVVRPIYPEYLVPSGFVHDYPTFLRMKELQGPTEDLKGSESYYSFQYPVETNRVKALTTIILKDSVNQTILPKMERIEGKDWIGLRIRQKGTITDLIINQLADSRLMHSNSWITAEGWETDAYLFAVQYPENGKPEQSSTYFLGYGSALRRDGLSYFGSLSKLNVIRKGNELMVEGQPLIRATFYAPFKPANLLLNGKNTSVDFDRNQLTVKIDNRK
ncbi:MAG TPA: heparinase II/III family protein [Bacteroidales bacterium]|nr:heparinase II/III family protein [Bacteroidales bacterium]